MKYKITNIHEVEADSEYEAIVKYQNRSNPNPDLRGETNHVVSDEIEEVV